MDAHVRDYSRRERAPASRLTDRAALRHPSKSSLVRSTPDQCTEKPRTSPRSALVISAVLLRRLHVHAVFATKVAPFADPPLLSGYITGPSSREARFLGNTPCSQSRHNPSTCRRYHTLDPLRRHAVRCPDTACTSRCRNALRDTLLASLEKPPLLKPALNLRAYTRKSPARQSKLPHRGDDQLHIGLRTPALWRRRYFPKPRLS